MVDEAREVSEGADLWFFGWERRRKSKVIKRRVSENAGVLVGGFRTGSVRLGGNDALHAKRYLGMWFEIIFCRSFLKST